MPTMPELLKARPKLRYIFTGGKGGVGKTVSAAGLAYHYAAGGEKVLLASLNPVHSLSSLFGQDLSGGKVRAVHGMRGVHAVEVETTEEVEDLDPEFRRPRLHEDMIKLTGITSQVRQIAVTNIGRDEPTLIISNDLTSPGKNLFARYAERMMIENELDAYISGFHLDALTSGVPLNVDLDTTLTVVAGNLYRLLAHKLSRYEKATPGTLWRDFLDATGTLHITKDGVTCALNLRSHHPALIDAGFADLETPIPWWDGRPLRFRFPPR